MDTPSRVSGLIFLGGRHATGSRSMVDQAVEVEITQAGADWVGTRVGFDLEPPGK